MKIIDFASTDFVHLKNTDCLVVDKTRYIYRLLKSGNRFVINTAPYGFGKSLIASMIEALFKGKSELFAGMYISDTDYDFAFHPVISIGLYEFLSKPSLKINEFISERLFSIAAEYGVVVSLSEPSRMLRLLCNELVSKFSALPVVIIDDYDIPLIAERNDRVDSYRFLKGFYSSLKGLVPLVRLIYLTGVYPPNMVGVLNEHSNIFDISSNKNYAGFMGFAEDELLQLQKAFNGF